MTSNELSVLGGPSNMSGLEIGAAVFGLVVGTIDIIRDIVDSGQSVLLLGRPGVGKTTMLREVARVLADDLKVMDASAVALCRDNNIPIVVFNIRDHGNLAAVLEGHGISTIVHNVERATLVEA